MVVILADGSLAPICFCANENKLCSTCDVTRRIVTNVIFVTAAVAMHYITCFVQFTAFIKRKETTQGILNGVHGVLVRVEVL